MTLKIKSRIGYCVLIIMATIGIAMGKDTSSISVGMVLLAVFGDLGFSK